MKRCLKLAVHCKGELFEFKPLVEILCSSISNLENGEKVQKCFNETVINNIVKINLLMMF